MQLNPSDIIGTKLPQCHCCLNHSQASSKMATHTNADFLNDPRFNQTFEYIPPGSTAGPFKIKYADYGYRNEAHPEQERIMLFSGPLMGSRLVLSTKDALAIKHKIRIISTDRPGMGGTDAVAPKDRLTVWRGTVRPPQ